MTRPVQYLVTTLLAIFVTGFAVEACAETNVVKPAAIYLSLSAADLGSTEWAIRNGASEGNGWMARDREVKQLAMASAFTAADVLLQSKGKKREARTLRVVYAVVRVAAIAINVTNARKGAR